MIRILIVVDIKLYSEGLAEVLNRTHGIAVVGTANCREDALRGLREREPDVVLLDMAMPDSFATLTTMLEQDPEINVVALAIPEIEAQVIFYAEAGVSGYVPREASLDDLVIVVTSAVRGELNCSPRIARSLLRRVNMLAGKHSPIPSTYRLTAREMEITHLIDQGMSNKEIARELRIGVSTVKNHVHNILDKLQVGRRSEAAALVRSLSRASNLPAGPQDPVPALPRPEAI